MGNPEIETSIPSQEIVSKDAIINRVDEIFRENDRSSIITTIEKKTGNCFTEGKVYVFGGLVARRRYEYGILTSCELFGTLEENGEEKKISLELLNQKIYLKPFGEENWLDIDFVDQKRLKEVAKLFGL